jgi:hypothetical protein
MIGGVGEFDRVPFAGYCRPNVAFSPILDMIDPERNEAVSESHGRGTVFFHLPHYQKRSTHNQKHAMLLLALAASYSTDTRTWVTPTPPASWPTSNGSLWPFRPIFGDGPLKAHDKSAIVTTFRLCLRLDFCEMFAHPFLKLMNAQRAICLLNG